MKKKKKETLYFCLGSVMCRDYLCPHRSPHLEKWKGSCVGVCPYNKLSVDCVVMDENYLFVAKGEIWFQGYKPPFPKVSVD
jgi:hypothetical protein